MTAKTKADQVEKQEPKRLTPWAPFDWHAKLGRWIEDNKATERIEWSPHQGKFVHTTKTGPGAWAETGTYASQKEFALAKGIIEPRDV